MSEVFHLYDTTLRDGAQREGLSFSVEDKLAVARQLDRLGVGFIEGGWPGANPKDTRFFERAKTELRLTTARLVAFGATRRPHTRAADDPQVAALRHAGATVVTLVAKANLQHVERGLRTTAAENLRMIRDTVRHLSAEGHRVFLDAEHFFDGYAHDAGYAREVLSVASEAGAEVVALCDTNGAMLPHRLGDVVHDIVSRGFRVGIHAHDDTGCAVANSLVAVAAGAMHVQGTTNGYGERCGNADLLSVIAALEVHGGRTVLPTGRLNQLSRTSRAVAEIANISPDPHQPWVGSSAFAHKAGLHVSAVKTDPALYQHVEPGAVGNRTRLVMSELAGRATVQMMGQALGLEPDPEATTRVLERIKDLEDQGCSFDAAEGSFELLLLEQMDLRPRLFDLECWRVIVEHQAGVSSCQAEVVFNVDGQRHTATATGHGPVHALDNALRQVVSRLMPELSTLQLLDYKVRVVNGGDGAAAVVRVLVTTTDGTAEWSTVAAGADVLAASWHGLVDSVDVAFRRLRDRTPTPDHVPEGG